MKAIQFKQANTSLAEDQEQYQTLPAFAGQLGDTPEQTGFIVCFELSPEDIEQIIKHKKIWYSQLTFGANMQPVNMFFEENIFEESQEQKEDPQTVIEHGPNCTKLETACETCTNNFLSWKASQKKEETKKVCSQTQEEKKHGANCHSLKGACNKCKNGFEKWIENEKEIN